MQVDDATLQQLVGGDHEAMRSALQGGEKGVCCAFLTKAIGQVREHGAQFSSYFICPGSEGGTLRWLRVRAISSRLDAFQSELGLF